MGRTLRCDEPGIWHHVMNRGIARRTLFETEDDIRFFLSRVARTVRRGQLELHAFCVLTTHFHLLVRSPLGELSDAMRRIQNPYVRRFNRRRRRDGTLVRGRFLSKPVTSLRYRHVLVRYIDENPVSAGLVSSACLYPHGSARHHAAERRPRWLCGEWIESCLRRPAGEPPGRYLDVFGAPLALGLRRLVEQRLEGKSAPVDPLDELLTAAPPAVLAWMRRKAGLADGTRPGVPLVNPESVEGVIAPEIASGGTWTVEPGRKAVDAWKSMRVGLLRELCGLTLEETALRTGLSLQGTCGVHRRHRRLVLEDDAYAMRAAELSVAALAACHGEVRAPLHG